LTSDVTEKDLRDLFVDCGEISEVRTILDHVTFLPKNYAFVEFKDHASAVNALRKTRKLRGNTIHVKFAKAQKLAPVEITDEKIVQFQSVTGLDIDACTAFLLENQGNVELAVASFFDPGAGEQTLIQQQLLKIADMEMKQKEGEEDSQKKTKKKHVKMQMINIGVLRGKLVENLTKSGNSKSEDTLSKT